MSFVHTCKMNGFIKPSLALGQKYGAHSENRINQRWSA